MLVIEDLVIEDVALSRELEAAIEAKMVQQQAAEKAVFRMQPIFWASSSYLTASHASFPVVSGNAWQWDVQLYASLRFSFSTNRSPTWMQSYA